LSNDTVVGAATVRRKRVETFLSIVAAALV